MKNIDSSENIRTLPTVNLVNFIFKSLLSVFVSIALFEYLIRMIFPKLTILQSHVLGILTGILLVWYFAHKAQKRQQKIYFEKLEEIKRSNASEERLKRLMERYYKLFQNTSEGVYYVERDGSIIEANKSFCRILGYGMDEVVGQSIVRFYVNPDDRKKFVSAIEEKGSVRDYEIFLKRKDGKHIFCSFSSTLIYSEQKEVLGYQGLMQDITERNRAQEELREHDALYKKFFSWVPGMIYQFTKRPDGSYCVPFSTEAIRLIFGCTPHDVSDDFSPIASVILPEDFDKVLDSIKDSAIHLTTWQCEYRVQIPGQSVRWVLGQSTPEKMADGSIAWYGFCTDITERKQSEKALVESEERLRDIAFSTADWIWEVDEKGIYTYSSQKGNDILGRSSEEIIGKTPFDFMPPDEAKRVAVIFSEVITGKSPINDLENWNIGKDGKMICFLTNGVPVLDEKGDLKGYRGVDKDITERKLSEERDRLNREEVERLAREMAIMAEIGRVIGSTLEIDEVYERFASEAQKLISFDRLSVNLHDIQEGKIKVAYIFGEEVPGRCKGDLFPLNDSVSEILIKTRAGLFSHPKNVDEMNQLFPNHVASIQAGMRSLLGVPLFYLDEVIGSLHFRSKLPDAYTEQDLRLAERIGAQITGAIINSQLFSQLKKVECSLRENEARITSMAFQDSLTDLPNRRSLEANLTQTLKRAIRRRQQFALFALDLNNFKAVNDTFGHAEGDNILKEAASKLKATVRDEDIVARIGGDEFAVLLPEIKNKADCDSILAKMKKALMELQSGNIGLSASIGFAIFPDDGGTFDVLLKVADDRMYRDKKS